MKKLILLMPVFLVGCAPVIHSIAHGGKNLKEAFINPQAYTQKAQAEYIEKQKQGCPQAFHEFKEKYFLDDPNTLFQNIYMTLDNSNYDSLLARLKTEGIQGEKGRLVLNKNVDKNNPLLLSMLYNEVNTYAQTAGQFVEGVEKRKNYRESMVGEKKPSYGLGEWPSNADICDSFFNETEYKDLVKNYELADQLADNIYNYAYSREKKDFHNKTGIYLSEDRRGEHANLIAYMLGYETPVKEYLYYLDGMEVLQNVSGGILAQMQPTFGYSNKTILVSTNKRFVDGTNLSGIPVVLTGTTSYNTLIGSNKTVYTFKIVDDSQFKKITDRYYFYPTYRERGNMDEKTSADKMKQLFTVIK